MSGQTKKIIIVVGLLVAAAGLLWFQTRPSEEDLIYQANIARSKEAEATGQPVPAAQPAASAAAAPTAGGGVAPASATPRLAQANVDLDELISGIEKVAFRYEDERRPRDPMRPLVGASAAVPTNPTTGAQAPPPGQAERAARSMRVTGIVWDAKTPLAVVTDRINNQRNDRVIWPGYVYHPLGIVVDTIEPDRVILRVNQSLIPIELEER
jgi:hypothetical protein